MIRATLISLLVLLSGTVAPTIAAPQPTTIANSIVRVGWTKAQVKAALGKPNRTSKDQNIWYYSKFAIQFTDGKVSSFPGAAG